MAQLKDTIVTGDARVTGTLYANLKGTIDGHTVAVDVPSGAKFTDTTYDAMSTSDIDTAIANA